MRNRGIDGLRVVGVVAVVVGHVWDGQLSRIALYSWHVPVFFFLSGFLWKSGRTVTDELRGRWLTLGRPYVFWFLVMSALVVWRMAMTSELSLADSLRPLLGGAYAGRPYSAFWFVTALLAAVLMARILQNCAVWIKAAVSLSALMICYVVPGLVAKIPFSLGVAVACLVFIYSGQLARRILDYSRTRWLIWAGVTALGFVPFVWGAARPLDLKQADFGTPGLSVLASVAICAGLLGVFQALYRRAGELVSGATERLAVAGFGVVLSHAGVLFLLNTPPNGWWPDVMLALVLPWGLSLGLAATKLGGWATGARPASGARRGRHRRVR